MSFDFGFKVFIFKVLCTSSQHFTMEVSDANKLMEDNQSSRSRIQVDLSFGERNGFIWSLEMATNLRSQHRILGNFNRPIFKQNQRRTRRLKPGDQTDIVGLPFILSVFEIRFSFEKNEMSIIHHTPSTFTANHNVKKHNVDEDPIHQFFIENNVKRMESLKEQCQYQRNKTQIESTSIGSKRALNATDILDHQRNEEKSPWNQLDSVKVQSTRNIVAAVSQNRSIRIAPSANDFVIFPQQLSTVFSFKEMATTYDPKAFWMNLCGFTDSEYVRFNAKYKVFQNLHENGFWIRPDLRFGADFIIYDSSPLVAKGEEPVHAKYTVHIISEQDPMHQRVQTVLDEYCVTTTECKDDQDTGLVELDISVMSRVRSAVSVGKHALFAFPDLNGNESRYYTVKWHYSRRHEEDEYLEMDPYAAALMGCYDDNETEMWYHVYDDIC